jgi:hypothetical protein
MKLTFPEKTYLYLESECNASSQPMFFHVGLRFLAIEPRPGISGMTVQPKYQKARRRRATAAPRQFYGSMLVFHKHMYNRRGTFAKYF